MAGPTLGTVVLVVGTEGTGHHFLDAIFHQLRRDGKAGHVNYEDDDLHTAIVKGGSPAPRADLHNAARAVGMRCPRLYRFLWKSRCPLFHRNFSKEDDWDVNPLEVERARAAFEARLRHVHGRFEVAVVWNSYPQNERNPLRRPDIVDLVKTCTRVCGSKDRVQLLHLTRDPERAFYSNVGRWNANDRKLLVFESRMLEDALVYTEALVRFHRASGYHVDHVDYDSLVAAVEAHVKGAPGADPAPFRALANVFKVDEATIRGVCELMYRPSTRAATLPADIKAWGASFFSPERLAFARLDGV